MTRKELMEWAHETANRIIHGKHQTQTFIGKLGRIDDESLQMGVWIDFHDTEHRKVYTFLPPLDLGFKPGDKVEIIIRKI